MLDQLRQVAIFAKTVDHGSFRAAARELRLSPSVVSHHISQLEQHLGVVLLHRSTRKLSLTPEGERLLAASEQMLSTVEGVLTDLSNNASSRTGELKLTTPSVLVESQLTDMLATFSMKNPGIKLSIDSTDVRQDMIDGGHDIAIRMGLSVKASAVTRILFQTKRRLVASRAYLKDRPPVTNPEELMSWDWIGLSQVQHIKPTFHKAKSKTVTIKPIAHIDANSAQYVYRLACAGAGLAVIPEFLAEEDMAAGVVDYVLPDWKIDPLDVYATWSPNAPKDGLVKLLIDEISPDQSLR